MGKHITQFIARLKQIVMTDAERDAVRTSISSYADFHPVYTAASEENTKHGAFVFSAVLVRRVIIALFLIVFVGAGTVSAADRAIPGDVLFPVDKVVEEVRLVLAGQSKKVELELAFTEERVSEFEVLIQEAYGAVEAEETLAVMREEVLVSENEGAESAVLVRDEATAETDTTKDRDTRVARLDRGFEEALTSVSRTAERIEREEEEATKKAASEKLTAVLERLNTNLDTLPEEAREHVSARYTETLTATVTEETVPTVRTENEDEAPSGEVVGEADQGEIPVREDESAAQPTTKRVRVGIKEGKVQVEILTSERADEPEEASINTEETEATTTPPDMQETDMSQEVGTEILQKAETEELQSEIRGI